MTPRRDTYGEPIEPDDDSTPADAVRHLLHKPRAMTHAPNCGHPGTTTTPGHSVDVTTCDGCGCLSTRRHDTSQTLNERSEHQ
jgi:hypothetical protein